MILGFLFFIQTFLKHRKALSTEKYKRYINILLLLFIIILSDISCRIKVFQKFVYHKGLQINC